MYYEMMKGLFSRYAPSLRSLRASGASCYILRLPPIDSNRLVDRLDSIAKAEDLIVDKRFLSVLVESSGRDIRSCLNILQVTSRPIFAYGFILAS